MLSELNEYFNGDMSDDYWYDDALFLCEDILKELSDGAWNELLKTIPNESTKWKIRLAECLGGIKEPYDLQCIMEMINTDSSEVFVACIDSLRDMKITGLLESEKNKIINRVESLVQESTLPVKKILEDFLKKYN